MSPSDAIAALLQLPGWTETRIAKEVGTSQPTVNRIKGGSEPSWKTGEAIVQLAQRELASPPVPSPEEHSNAA
jgi:DNA-binding XRE family transcriptional regulator